VQICRPTHVLHLAAQAGVRYANVKPLNYLDSNVHGTTVLFEAVKAQQQRPLVIYASSSSVYGSNAHVPFSEEDRVDSPLSLYAATKRTCELLANVYHGISGISVTGLRFFTVYGPWGRPDMAALAFAHQISRGHPVKIYQGPGQTELARDFTYIDDIIQVRASNLLAIFFVAHCLVMETQAYQARWLANAALHVQHVQRPPGQWSPVITALVVTTALVP
jgi:UDP-glucuronate 4-epimerase